MKWTLSIILMLSGLAASAEPWSFQGTDVLTKSSQTIQFPSNKDTTVFVFLSAQCPCSASHEEVLQKLAQDFPEVNLIGVNSNADETLAMAQEHFKKANLPFPILRDAQTKLADKLGALKTPHSYVFNRQGELIYHGGVTNSHVGSLASKHYLREVLEDLKAGKSPRHKEVRSLGCYIQRN